ncbi:MAG TPA: 50S ribosomal protein L11 methyltransferase [Chthoniobacterales bacterium]|jgi:ribosomal protein L11 methyltransferase
MYLWQKLASSSWLDANEYDVATAGGKGLAIIERPGRKRITLEIPCRTRTQANELRRQFGGRVIKLRRDWLNRFARAEKSKPLRIGKRLVITNVEGTSASRLRAVGMESRRPSSSNYGLAGQGRSHIIIPAGAAFGTGQHATTAMSLRLLEQLTRKWAPGWAMIDLGTGSGILALAAKRLGAGKVIGVDIDSVAISTAKGNARLNAIGGVEFKVADVLKWRPPAQFKIVTANLFSELLIAVLPRLRGIPWVILSGVMPEQERELNKAFKRNRMEILQTKRRGKWVALLIKRGGK